MRGYKKLLLIFTLITIIIIIAVNLIYNRFEHRTDTSNYYKVEIHRALNNINNQEIDLSAYDTLTAVEILDDDTDYTELSHFFRMSNDSYTIVEKNSRLYRFTYENINERTYNKTILNLSLGISALAGYALLIVIYVIVIRPFNRIKSFPDELSRGKFVQDLPQQRSKVFGRFIWGLNMLKETLDHQKEKEIQLQKEKQTLILSISHDIKTPLSAIKLYSKALSKKLYEDEEKILAAAIQIDEKADEIQRSIDAIIKTSTEEFIDFHVNHGEFYINDLTERISIFYGDKLASIRTAFSIGPVKNCLIKGDLDRMCEVVENLMENAIKYGDGREIKLTFSTEEDCLLMNVGNSGCTLHSDEISHIFTCFRRGTNSSHISGSGLGLYIARNLMTRMGGEAYAQVLDGNFYVTVVMKKA